MKKMYYLVVMFHTPAMAMSMCMCMCMWKSHQQNFGRLRLGHRSAAQSSGLSHTS